jgi:hypothetical protein
MNGKAQVNKESYWCVLTIAVRLILPSCIAFFKTGATLAWSGKLHHHFMPPFYYITTHSGGLAGSIMTASFDLSSITR